MDGAAKLGTGQHIPRDSVQPRPGIVVAAVITAPRSERSYPDLAKQIVGGLVPGASGEVPVNSDLVTFDNLDECFGFAAQRPRHQLAVGKVSPQLAPSQRRPSHGEADMGPVDDDARASGRLWPRSWRPGTQFQILRARPAQLVPNDSLPG